MKRILVTLLAVGALGSLGAGSALATGTEDGEGTSGGTTTVTDTSQTNVAEQIAQIVQSGAIVYICMEGATCGDAILVNLANVTQIVWQCNTTAAGSCNIQYVVPPAEPAAGSDGSSGPNNVFLCYSDSQVQPGVWPEDVARALRAQGYWEPAAVWGTVYKGTNIGDFHLVCNTEGDTAGDVLGGDGTVLTEDDVGGSIGYYPIIVG